MKQEYIPALRFHWLTNIYDWLISNFMPEKQFKQQLLNNADIKENDKVLDFGVGTATLSIMAYQNNSKAIYTGIDVDGKILELANEKIRSSNAHIKTIQYAGKELPFDNGTYNRVITSLVIHHLTDEQKKITFQEVYRILKPNGELHIADWGKPSNILMRLCFYLVQFLDGFKTTSANVNGKLPDIITSAGFTKIEITHSYNSVLGTVQLFKIKK